MWSKSFRWSKQTLCPFSDGATTYSICIRNQKDHPCIAFGDTRSLICSRPGPAIDYRCDNRRFWLSAHDCQVPTPTSQNLELEQQFRIFWADWLSNCLEDWNPQFLICRSIYQKKANPEKLGLGIDNPCRIVFWVCRWTSAWRGLMTGIFGILESSATPWYQDVAPTQEFFFFSSSHL